MAEPFSFFDTTLDKPKEDYTSALLGKKPKENAFASPQVNPMMAQTQILGQAPVAQPQVALAPVEQTSILGQAPSPVASGIGQINGYNPMNSPEAGTAQILGQGGTTYNPMTSPEAGTTQILGQAPVVQPQVEPAPTTAELLKSIGGFAAGNDPNFEYTPTAKDLAEAEERAKMDEAANLVLAKWAKEAKEYEEAKEAERLIYSPFGGIGVSGSPAGTGKPSPIIEGIKTAFTPAWKQEQQAQQDIINAQLAAGENAFATGEGLDPVTKEAIANATKTAATTAGTTAATTAGTTAATTAGTTASPVADMAQVDPNSPQADFLRAKERLGGQPMTNDQIARATRYAASMGTTFDPETGYSRGAFLAGEPAPRPNNLTTVGGTPLNEFLSGAAIPDQGFARAENAMYGDNSLSRGLGGDVAMKAFQDASEARDARLGQNSGQARGPESKDRGSGMSTEESMRLSGGDPKLAEQMIQLEKMGYDPVTKQPIKKGLTPSEQLAWDKHLVGQENFNRQFAANQEEKAAELAAGKQETVDGIIKQRDRMDSQLDFLTRSAVEMSSLQDWSTEGFAGWFAEKLPFATKAAQVNRLATSFQGNAFLRSIIDSKSLGATFGALSDSEGNKITAAETTLMDTKQLNKDRMAAAKQIIDIITSARDKAVERLSKEGVGNKASGQPQAVGNVPNVEGTTIIRIS